jgi:hypothetical protein
LKKSPLYPVLGILQVFIALGALGGGFVLMISPKGSAMGISVSALSGTPFRDYFLPGLLLFAFNGLGCLAASVYSFLRHRLAGWLGIFFGGGLFAWIVVQICMIGYWKDVPIQPFYAALGLFEAGLGLGIVLVTRLPHRAAQGPEIR